MKFKQKLLQGLGPSQNSLLIAVSKMMSDNMLRSIAEADYGYEAESCYRTLDEIRKTYAPPLTVDFCLQEVLELTRWREVKTREEHLSRFFAVINLLIMSPLHQLDTADCATLVAFLESVYFFEREYVYPSIQLLSWRILEDFKREKPFYDKPDDDPYEEIEPGPFFLYTLLLLLLLDKKDADVVEEILDWLIENEKRFTCTYEEGENYLFSSYDFNPHRETYQAIAEQIFCEADYLNQSELKVKLNRVKTWLTV